VALVAVLDQQGPDARLEKLKVLGRRIVGPSAALAGQSEPSRQAKHQRQATDEFRSTAAHGNRNAKVPATLSGMCRQ
jgi:hypothetical protein